MTIVLILAGSFVGFVLSSTAGVGGAIIMVPLLSLVVPTASAVALASPVMLVNNLGKLLALRGAVNVGFLGKTLLGALPGAAVGATLVGVVPETILRRGIGVFMLGYVGWELFARNRASNRPGRMSIAAWGLATGFTAAILGAGGPTNSAAMNSAGLTRQGFVATGAAISVAIQLIKLPIFSANGALRFGDWPLGAALCVVAITAAYVGRALLARVSERFFRILLLTCFFGLGLLMLR